MQAVVVDKAVIVMQEIDLNDSVYPLQGGDFHPAAHGFGHVYLYKCEGRWGGKVREGGEVFLFLPPTAV